MIRFDRLWKTMERKQVTTYQLREKCGIDSKTIRRLRANENMETKTLNKLCTVLECGMEDIAEYLKSAVREGDGVVVMGAGDIYNVFPKLGLDYRG